MMIQSLKFEMTSVEGAHSLRFFHFAEKPSTTKPCSTKYSASPRIEGKRLLMEPDRRLCARGLAPTPGPRSTHVSSSLSFMVDAICTAATAAAMRVLVVADAARKYQSEAVNVTGIYKLTRFKFNCLGSKRLVQTIKIRS
eukprot:Opistho-2@20046